MAVLAAFRGQRRKERHARRGLFLLPSLFTVANLFCGYACLVYTLRGEFATAAPFLGIALVLDTLDGRIARMTGAASAFGEEFDSLADIVSFGVAPAVMTSAWGLAPFGRLGWAAGFLFVVAAPPRLARFNIQSAAVDKRYFVGMPSPAAACVLAATVFVSPAPLTTATEALPVFLVVLLPAALMVTTLRFRSFKEINLGHRRSYLPLLAMAVIIAVITAHPPFVLAGMAYSYLASGPLEALIGRVRRRGRPDRAEIPAVEPDAMSSGTDGPVPFS
jgi:CDP-diacylglycerol--serine O-phosphatidyltransferase